MSAVAGIMAPVKKEDFQNGVMIVEYKTGGQSQEVTFKAKSDAAAKRIIDSLNEYGFGGGFTYVPSDKSFHLAMIPYDDVKLSDLQGNLDNLFTFAESNFATYERTETNSWSASGRAGWGPWSARVRASGSSTSTNSSVDVSNFNMKFLVTQVPLSRPWFSPEFLTNSAWRFKVGLGMSPLSDGGKPPKGQLVAYPTTAIFVRDIVVDFNELRNSASSYTSQFSAGGGVSYGPFSLGGSYSRSVGSRSFNSKITAQGLEVEGMQLIGFKCAILPKSPNPDPAITSWK
jgi:hypothetical protein